jgi:hypothetical protein
MPLTFDHIIPEAGGGLTVRSNLWLACERCNRHKGDRTSAVDPQTDQEAALFNPRIQRWQEHFEWGDQGTLIVGVTPVGRATVLALQLNHPLAVSARRYWTRAGWHPPLE